MELHDHDSRKVKSYGNAIFNLERLDKKLREMTDEEILAINGVGPSIAKSIREILDTGTLGLYEELKADTEPGLMELLNIRGIGAGKVRLAWKELDVDSVQKMLDMIESGKLEELKGFGKKTVENLHESLRFFLRNKGKLLLPEAMDLAKEIRETIEATAATTQVAELGDLALRRGVVNELRFLLTDSEGARNAVQKLGGFSVDRSISGPYSLRGKIEGKDVAFKFCDDRDFKLRAFLESGSSGHFRALEQKGVSTSQLKGDGFSEESLYRSIQHDPIPNELREGLTEFTRNLDDLVELGDLKGVLHAHSTYSDGRNTLREMAEACISKGFQYLGITDHSKAAFYYANGMYENRVLEQHKEIDQLNKELAPFKIFKGIESDILVDGDLDYELSFLENFDFVIASVHSVLNMDTQKATQRLLNAIDNPYTTIMGHLTGRVLLQRRGLPVDHKQLIDRCIENEVIIEINAHPSRLDLDWKWVHYALDKGMKISINPDAHSIAGIDDMRWGVISGRKGGLTTSQTLNAMTADELDKYFKERLKKRKAAIS